MTTTPFELVDTHSLSALAIDVNEYRHRRTGARHIHFAADDRNNAFLVAFLTVPQDSTGVAHILEHTSLCGSRRFPVRDPFFMMIRRSLNTFMNAFTASDWTAYPFATQNRKDFDNLLQVYLDAAFFPRLDALDFAQEGHRIEFEEEGDTSSALVYKGVVYNEMKGAMSAPLSQVAQTLQSHLFPSITYHHNSGGEPSVIPELTHADLKAFHARHYHPSNAVFMTYGDFPVAEHHARMEELALKDFDALELNLDVPDETRFEAPVQAHEAYTIEGDEPLDERTHVAIGWLLGKSTDTLEIMKARLLSGVLLDHSASPMRKALETSDLGSSPSPLCGLDDSTREATFVCGLEGTEADRADAIEALIFDVLRDVAKHGVDDGAVESVLHQIELSQREVSGGGFPYGLQLMVRALGTMLHGGRALDALDLNPVIEQLRTLARDPKFIPSLAQSLIDNPHRVRLTMTPDPTLSDAQNAAEASRLSAIKETITATDAEEIVKLAEALKARQEADDDADLLPKVGLEDVPPDLRIPRSAGVLNAGPMPVTWFTPGTNGLFYHQLVIELPELSKEQFDLLPLFCDCLTEVGCGADNYLSIQERQAAFTGGLGARTSIRASLTDVNLVQQFVVLSSKALVRNQGEMVSLVHSAVTQARFDEHQRIKELVAQMRAHAEAQVSDQGHVLALSAASAGHGPCGYLDHHWGGLVGLQTLKALDQSLRDPQALAALGETLTSIRDALAAAPMQALAIAEEDFKADINTSIEAAWPATTRPAKGVPAASLAYDNARVAEAWSVNSQVNFCAKAYPAVPEGHADAPALRVLAPLLRNGYLHRAIREQGGAYGAGATYSADSGSFRFYSYRDPRLTETLDDFDRSVAWLHDEKHQGSEL
ncbi:MAG: insulinase family protein, partial [Gammaproteobacteria bacterium]|nr:insulinase family protein [Gammaproteobacteria bacterium]